MGFSCISPHEHSFCANTRGIGTNCGENHFAPKLKLDSELVSVLICTCIAQVIKRMCYPLASHKRALSNHVLRSRFVCDVSVDDGALRVIRLVAMFEWSFWLPEKFPSPPTNIECRKICNLLAFPPKKKKGAEKCRLIGIIGGHYQGHQILLGFIILIFLSNFQQIINKISNSSKSSVAFKEISHSVLELEQCTFPLVSVISKVFSLLLLLHLVGHR